MSKCQLSPIYELISPTKLYFCMIQLQIYSLKKNVLITIISSQLNNSIFFFIIYSNFVCNKVTLHQNIIPFQCQFVSEQLFHCFNKLFCDSSAVNCFKIKKIIMRCLKPILCNASTFYLGSKLFIIEFQVV